MQNKHLEKKHIGIQLKHLLGLILYNTLIYQINKAVNSRLKVISLRHNTKLIRLREQQNKPRKDEQKKIHRQIVHNYSTYTLSDKLYKALSFDLDTHIPVTVNKNGIYTEFEVFFQSLLKDISNIPENELRQIKTNLRNTCDKYTKIKVIYKSCQRTIRKKRYCNLVIMNRDK